MPDLGLKFRLLFFLTFAAGTAFLGWIIATNRHEFANEWTQIRGTYLTNTQNLKTTTGEIQISDVYSEQVGYRIAPFTKYRYRILYTYQAGDRSFFSRQVAFASDGFTVRKDATLYNYLYPAGATVIVYYDPAHPEFAVLNPTKTADDLEAVGYLLLYAAGIVSALAGILLLGRRNRRTKTGPAQRE